MKFPKYSKIRARKLNLTMEHLILIYLMLIKDPVYLQMYS